jgi:hypothetical protein
MEPNIEQRLRTIEKKIDDMYGVVIKTRKAQRTAGTVRALYWIFIILLGFGAFYFVGPYINSIKDSYGFGASESDTFNNLLEQLNAQQDN